jgi:NodT family efflux transporter outer membrane factor (OMF) lipoprotein
VIAARRMLVSAALSIIAAGLSGCMVGPDFKRPDPPKDASVLPAEERIAETASANALGGQTQHFVQEMDIPATWWNVFQSKPLDELIDQSMKANPDVQSAIAALKVAQQNARAQRAALYPTFGPSLSLTQNQSSTVISPVLSNPINPFGLITALLNVAYVLDVFGGVRRATESADATTEQTCYLLEAAYLTLSSNVVVAAITEASLRGQIAATERTIAAQRETLTLLQRRFAIGQAARADVAAQEAALAQAEVTLPPLRNQLSQQRHLLAQLTGQTTAHVPAATFELTSLQLPEELPDSLPSRLLEQRPDVRAAEANVHAAAASIGVAIANQLPQFSISINYGWQSQTLGDLFDPQNGITSLLGGTVSQTWVDGGALQAKRRAAEAAFEQAKAQYRSTVLTAIRNVADTLRALEFDALTLAAAANAEKAAGLSLEITRRRLEAGDAGILDILNAEATYQAAVLAMVQAQGQRFSDTAALYQALGGGWWNRDADSVLTPARRATCKGPGGQPVGSNAQAIKIPTQPWPEAFAPPDKATTAGGTR